MASFSNFIGMFFLWLMPVPRELVMPYFVASVLFKSNISYITFSIKLYSCYEIVFIFRIYVIVIVVVI